MTVLTLIQTTCNELGLQAPSQVINNTDPTIVQLTALANREGKELRSAFLWPQCNREYTFNLSSSTTAYVIPADFDYFVFRTFWDRTNHWELIGPLSPQEWQWRQSGISSNTPRRNFRVKGITDNQFFIFPDPGTLTSTQTLVFEYQSITWLRPATWVTNTAYAAGAYSSYNGNIYNTASGGTSGATPPTHTSGSDSDGGVTWVYVSNGYDIIRADTDEILLSEDIVSLGIQWRFLRAKGFEYEPYKEQWEQEIRREASSLSGARTLSLNRRDFSLFLNFYNIPDSGYGS